MSLQGKQFIFKNTKTEEVLVLPVTPANYHITHGRKAVQVDMNGSGSLNLPGEEVMLDEKLTCFFPAHNYPFCQPDAGTNPFVPLEKLEKWSDNGDPVRFIVAGTPVNALVLLDPIEYGEEDGSGDLAVTISMRGYRILNAPGTENETRPVETEPDHPAEYVVQRGDTLSAIAQWVYGDAGLYARLAAANNIANPNLIFVGQRLVLPGIEALPAEGSPVRGANLVKSVETSWVATGIDEENHWTIQLKKENAMDLG